MGVYINLDVKFNKVSEELWRDTFNEVVSFIDKTPLGDIVPYNHDKGKSFIYNKSEVLKSNTTGYRSISMSADLNRMTHCEVFKLHDTKDAYTYDKEDVETETTIWREKTQRFAYHKYILAIGMLIEHRLPGAAYVSGDINEEEIKEAKKLLKEIHNIDVNNPERYKNSNSTDILLTVMSMLGARFGDIVAENEDCLDFGKHVLKEVNGGNRQELNDYTNDELKTVIIDTSNHYGITWSKDILQSILETSDRDILLGYAATLTVDCSNRDAFEHVSRFFKDKEVYNAYLELIAKS